MPFLDLILLQSLELPGLRTRFYVTFFVGFVYHFFPIVPGPAALSLMLQQPGMELASLEQDWVLLERVPPAFTHKFLITTSSMQVLQDLLYATMLLNVF